MGCSRFVQHGLVSERDDEPGRSLPIHMGIPILVCSMVSLGCLLCAAYFWDGKQRAEGALIDQRITDMLARSMADQEHLQKTAMAYARGRQDALTDAGRTCSLGR